MSVEIAHIVSNIAYWVGAVLLYAIGCVRLGLGKSDIKGLGVLLTIGGVLLGIVAFIVAISGDVAGGTLTAAFAILALLAGIGLWHEELYFVSTHADFISGLIFLIASLQVLLLGFSLLGLALILLAAYLLAASIPSYFGKEYPKLDGILAFLDGWAFFFLVLENLAA